MKRLLCIISSMNAGGAETFLMKIYRCLDRNKYQMDFCVNSKDNYYEDEITKLGGKIYVIPSKSENLKKFRKNLSEIISTNQYKYIFRITSNTMGFYDLKIAKDSGAERCVARSSNSSDGEGLKVRIAHKLGRILYGRYVDVKIAPSDLAAKYTFGHSAYEKKEVFILHNAVDIERYKYDIQNRELVRKEYSIAEDTLVVGHIGRFSEQKNHLYLLKIFKEIYEKNSNSILMLVGKGELQDKIKQQAEKLGILDHIIFTGVRADIPNILSAMDIFVFPSFYEGMPNTVIEAQATGLPCVIADTITKEANITGLVTYKSLEDNPEAWAITVLESIKKERKDTKLDFIKNQYDIQSIVKKFTKIIYE